MLTTTNAGGVTQSANPAGDLAGVIDQTVQQEASSLRGEIKAVREQMKEQITDIRQSLGRIPIRQSVNPAGVHVGGSARSGEGYSLVRAAAYATGRMSREEAAYEVDVHDRLTAELVDRAGFQRQSGRGGMLIPLGSRHLSGVSAGLASEVRESFAAGIAGCDPDELRFAGRGASAPVRQALSSYDDAALAAFVSTGGTGEMIDLLRSQEVTARLGAREITLPPSGRLPFPRQTGASSATWLGENAPIPESEPSTGAASLVAKKLATLIRLPNELIRFASNSLEMFVRLDMARSMALAVDSAFLTGTGGSYRPLGLLNTEGVQYLPAGTAGANGDRLEPRDLTRAISAVEEADVPTDGFGWAVRPSLWGSILERRASAVTTGDGEGAYLFPTDRGSVATGRPAALRGFPAVTSTQVPGDRQKGDRADLTCLIGGAWDQMVVGRAGVLEIVASDEAGDAFARDQTLMRGIQHIDMLIRHPQAFTVIDQIDPDLPA